MYMYIVRVPISYLTYDVYVCVFLLLVTSCIYIICTYYSAIQREGFSKFNKIYEFDFNILGKVGELQACMPAYTYTYVYIYVHVHTSMYTKM